MLLHISTQGLDLRVGTGYGFLIKGGGVFLKDLFQKKEHGLFLFKPGRMPENGIIKSGHGPGDLASVNHILCEIRFKVFSGDLLNKPLHHLGIDVHGTVIQGLPVQRSAAVVVPGIKQKQIPGTHIIFLVLAPEMTLSSLNKPNDVEIMKMVGEFLYDSAQLIGFYFQVAVIVHMALFLFL